ncbi:MAG: hypothetical protein U0795_13890 [Pirellulales bacterium]
MFDQVAENLRKATESSMQLQQEMMKNWSQLVAGAVSGIKTPGVASGLGVPSAPGMPSVDAFVAARKRWEEWVVEAMKRQRELVDAQFQAGIKNLEGVFDVAESKTPQEIQEKVTELYRKCFESIKQLSESHLTEFKKVAEQWVDVAKKGAA